MFANHHARTDLPSPFLLYSNFSILRYCLLYLFLHGSCTAASKPRRLIMCTLAPLSTRESAISPADSEVPCITIVFPFISFSLRFSILLRSFDLKYLPVSLNVI